MEEEAIQRHINESNLQLRKIFYQEVVKGIYTFPVAKAKLGAEIDRLGLELLGQEKGRKVLGDEEEKEFGTDGLTKVYLCTIDERTSKLNEQMRGLIYGERTDLTPHLQKFGFRFADPVTFLNFIHLYAENFPSLPNYNQSFDVRWEIFEKRRKGEDINDVDEVKESFGEHQNIRFSYSTYRGYSIFDRELTRLSFDKRNWILGNFHLSDDSVNYGLFTLDDYLVPDLSNPYYGKRDLLFD